MNEIRKNGTIKMDYSELHRLKYNDSDFGSLE